MSEAKKEVKKLCMQVSWVQTSVDMLKAKQHKDAGSRKTTEQFKQIFVDSGGLSRLTIFNNK